MTEDEKRRAAVELKNSPLFSLIMEQLRTDAINEWSQSEPVDSDTRRAAYYKQRALTEIEATIDNIVARPTGHL